MQNRSPKNLSKSCIFQTFDKETSWLLCFISSETLVKQLQAHIILHFYLQEALNVFNFLAL